MIKFRFYMWVYLGLVFGIFIVIFRYNEGPLISIQTDIDFIKTYWGLLVGFVVSCGFAHMFYLISKKESSK